MWHAVFSRSMIALTFAAATLLGYLSLQLKNTYFAGPFYAIIPLPFCIAYFWRYCDRKFKTPSMSLTLEFAVEMDRRNRELQAQGKPLPNDTFVTDLTSGTRAVQTQLNQSSGCASSSAFGDVYISISTIICTI
eukprot:gene1721-3331_t